MKAESLNSVEMIKDSSGIIIGVAIHGRSTISGTPITTRFYEQTYSKYTRQATDSNGSAETKPGGFRHILPSSPVSMSVENLSPSLIGLLTKYSASILISSLLWATLLFGLYVAGLAS